MNRPGRRPLKIGYVWQYDGATVSPVAATSLHVQAVVQGFQQQGHHVRMVSIRNGIPHWTEDLKTWTPVQTEWKGKRALRLVERALRKGQSLLHLPYLRLFESYAFARACWSALEGYDVLYERFWWMASGGLMAGRKLGAPIVYEVNGDLVEEYTLLGIKLSKIQWAAMNQITRLMFTRAGRVVTVSEPLRKRTMERWHLAPEQVQAISNGARVDLFSQTGRVEGLCERYGLNGDPVIIFVGSFKPWHGLDLLVEAVSRLETPAQLVMVGDGPTRADLQAQAERLGIAKRIVFTGAVPHPDVAALLQTAQVAVLNPRLSPASASQSPLKLFEYMAAGKAIVGPAAPNVEGLLVDRVTARLIPPDDSPALAVALAELLNDAALRHRLGQAAQQQALEKHSWKRVVMEIEDIFYQELGEK